MLQAVDDNFKDAINDACILSAKLIHGRPQKWSETRTTQKTSQEERGNIHVVA
jgi:hypothetical protein